MTKAAGYWAWWNQYGSVPIAKCVERAKQLGPQGGVICKWGFTDEFNAFKNAGIRVAVEKYVYPGNPIGEADHLASWIALGAEFAVINAEVEWEVPAGGPAMQQLVTRLQQQCPGVEMYASVDTRGNRTHGGVQQVLGAVVAGWFPEVYPKAFRPTMPAGAVVAAFNDCVAAGQDFKGKPILPTLQTYDGIGTDAVILEMIETRRRGFPGCQAYTICHATDAEWAAFVAAIPQEVPVPTADDFLRAAQWCAEAAAQLAQKKLLTDEQKQRLRFLAG